jgi:choline dehydrogenase-like flavoprotein
LSRNVAVVGSGLSAIGAIKALRQRGIRPTVLDWGERLDSGRSCMVEALASKPPQEWTAQERDLLNHNPTVEDGSAIPRKLVFGSDYFYGKPRPDAPIEAEGSQPPFSYALGGLSAGWGAAVLPPQACDLADWPVGVDELNDYCCKVLAGMPYSAREDGLSLNFPLLTPGTGALRLSRASGRLLDALNAAALAKKDDVVFGQARLLVNAAAEGSEACRYCGQCMSGCVYGSIYKAGDEIAVLHEAGEIEYLAGCLVDKVSEEGSKVIVSYCDSEGRACLREFDKVFLAAGAVNSARVVLNSLDLLDHEVHLKTRGGFVMPVFSLRKLPIDWPDCNTQPGLFLELKGKKLEHWVHVQVSTDNELLLQKLGIRSDARGFMARIKRFIAGHVLLLFVNYHSDHAGHYKLWLTRAAGAARTNALHTSHRIAAPQFRVLWTSCLKLFGVLARVGCLPLYPFARLNSGAYHVGGTLPMKAKPSGKLETDVLGRVDVWQRIHVVDTSVFPSLPGTTIGLLAMANAYRIVDKADWSERTGG